MDKRISMIPFSTFDRVTEQGFRFTWTQIEVKFYSQDQITHSPKHQGKCIHLNVNIISAACQTWKRRWPNMNTKSSLLQSKSKGTFLRVEINCLALSISSEFWFNWLVHAIQYGIRAGGPRIKS
jgi:hypothetical protein